jgi:hypothetical protein
MWKCRQETVFLFANWKIKLQPSIWLSGIFHLLTCNFSWCWFVLWWTNAYRILPLPVLSCYVFNTFREKYTAPYCFRSTPNVKSCCKICPVQHENGTCSVSPQALQKCSLGHGVRVPHSEILWPLVNLRFLPWLRSILLRRIGDWR